jgi:hypothetical protein
VDFVVVYSLVLSQAGQKEDLAFIFNLYSVNGRMSATAMKKITNFYIKTGIVPFRRAMDPGWFKTGTLVVDEVMLRAFTACNLDDFDSISYQEFLSLINYLYKLKTT